MTPDEIWAAVDRKEHVALEYSKQMESLGIDLIITPGGLLPAPDKVSIYDRISSSNCLNFQKLLERKSKLLGCRNI